MSTNHQRHAHSAPSSNPTDEPRAPTLAVVEPGDPPSERRDRWTPARQVAFLRELAASHNVAGAARSVGMSRQSAYRLRARLKNEPFGMAWDAAFQNAFDGLAAAAMDRALNGVDVPHYHRGELVGTSRRFDERLTVALLGMRSGFLRAAPPPFDPSAAYDPDDFAGLLDRVAQGPAHWDGHEEEEV